MKAAEKRRLLTLSSSGLFIIALAQTLGFLSEISDLTRGIMTGSGIGLMLLSLGKRFTPPRYSKVKVRSNNR